MFCPQCGAQVADGARFCPKCGSEFSAQRVDAPGPTAAAGTTPAGAGSVSFSASTSTVEAAAQGHVETHVPANAAPAAPLSAPAPASCTPAASASGEGALKLLLGVACVPSVMLGISFIWFLIKRLGWIVSAMDMYSEVQALVGIFAFAILVGLAVGVIFMPPILLADVSVAPGIRRSLWIKAGKTQWLGREERSRTLKNLDEAVVCAVVIPLLWFAGSLLFDELSLSQRGFDGPLYIAFNTLNSWFTDNILLYLVQTALVLGAVAYAHHKQLYPRVARV